MSIKHSINGVTEKIKLVARITLTEFINLNISTEINLLLYEEKKKPQKTTTISSVENIK